MENDRGDAPDHSDRFGVVYSRRYTNHAGGSIEVTLVYNDPSIDEYVQIIQNTGKSQIFFERSKRIKIKDTYPALEKNNLDEKYVELNILLRSNLLMNVVAVGNTEKSGLDGFLNPINLQAIVEMFGE